MKKQKTLESIKNNLFINKKLQIIGAAKFNDQCSHSCVVLQNGEMKCAPDPDGWLKIFIKK